MEIEGNEFWFFFSTLTISLRMKTDRSSDMRRTLHTKIRDLNRNR